MAKSHELAKKFAVKYSSLSGDKDAAIDPSTIMVFLDMILGIVEIFKGCGKTPAQALASTHSPSLWDRLVLRRIVKQDMTRSEFKARGKELVDALLAGGKEVTEEDVKDLYNEV